MCSNNSVLWVTFMYSVLSELDNNVRIHIQKLKKKDAPEISGTVRNLVVQ